MQLFIIRKSLISSNENYRLLAIEKTTAGTYSKREIRLYKKQYVIIKYCVYGRRHVIWFICRFEVPVSSLEMGFTIDISLSSSPVGWKFTSQVKALLEISICISRSNSVEDHAVYLPLRLLIVILANFPVTIVIIIITASTYFHVLLNVLFPS